jgi:hypothetical protein
VNKKQFTFTMLDGSRGLHISESMVSISIRFANSSGQLSTGTGKVDS